MNDLHRALHARTSPMAGGAGMVVGVVAAAADRSAAIQAGLSPQWHVVAMSHPGDVWRRGAECDAIVLASGHAGGAEADRLVALESVLARSRAPLVVSGSAGALESWAHHQRTAGSSIALAVPRMDDNHLADIVLDCVYRPILSGLSSTIREGTNADPVLLGILADLVEHGVRSFREAATLMGLGKVPFVRHVKDLGGATVSRSLLKRRAAEAGLDLARFLHSNALFQGVLRYTPGRSYQIGVRLHYRSDDAFRMAVLRGLGRGLSDLGRVPVQEMTSRLLRELPHS